MRKVLGSTFGSTDPVVEGYEDLDSRNHWIRPTWRVKFPNRQLAVLEEAYLESLSASPLTLLPFLTLEKESDSSSFTVEVPIYLREYAIITARMRLGEHADNSTVVSVTLELKDYTSPLLEKELHGRAFFSDDAVLVAVSTNSS